MGASDLKKIDEIEVIEVSSVFANSINYIVPIYQRNYAWTDTQIEQLMEDIYSSIDGTSNTYFLGNLIVNQRDKNVYEVIDGQQRLTTLFLLEKYLSIKFSREALRFEAREKSNRTLSYISDNISYLSEYDSNKELAEDLLSDEILRGFYIVRNYFKNNNIDKDNFREKLGKVSLVRVQVPQKIDLNRYFEIMNTRGEQLELHEIAKAKLLGTLESDRDKNVAALIWEKCSDMNSYVQMNFNIELRKKLFTEDWSNLCDSINDFESIASLIKGKDELDRENSSEDKDTKDYTLFEILKNDKTTSVLSTQSEDENERFESIVSFPNFLLQVNAVIRKTGEDISLDDKSFLVNISWAWEKSEEAKSFLFHLLKCRVLFDKHVLKREFVSEYKETGKWSLRRLKKYQTGDYNYVATIGEEK